MRIPSERGFVEAWGPELGGRLYRLAKGIDPPAAHPAVKAWADRCYVDPRDPRAPDPCWAECLMVALNAELGGYGDEAIRGRYVDPYHGDLQAAYVNVGDSYAITILLDHELDRLSITSVGEWIESHPRRGIE